MMIIMEYRPFGNTGLRVSSLGLGVEHLKNQPPEYITEIIKRAIMNGINYFDLVWSLPDVIEGVSQALDGSDVHLAVHLGSSYRNRKYVKAKSIKRCEETFRETLDGLDKDSVSVINLHYVKGLKQWEEATRSNGILDLAIRLRDESLGRIIAISTHELDVVKLASNHPDLSSVMYQVNMTNHNLPQRDEILSFCKNIGMGLVAMKPYAGGNLLKFGKKVKFPEYKTGGLRAEYRIPSTLTDVKCLHYSLSQVGVSCVVFGVKNVHELENNLKYFSSNEEERFYDNEVSLMYNLVNKI
jgi:predicted aldo/keto reductase-like oxidoreductase